MKLKDKIKYCSTPGRIFMTLLTIISIVIILQVVIIEYYRAFVLRPPHRILKVQKYVTAVSPPVFNWIWRCEPVYTFFIHDSSNLSRDFMDTIGEMRPGYPSLNWILSVVLVLLALAHGWSRRTSWARLIFWLVFTAIFNLAGFLTYLALNHTPVVRCGVCGKRRGLEKNACCACQSDLPAPASRASDCILLRQLQVP